MSNKKLVFVLALAIILGLAPQLLAQVQT